MITFLSPDSLAWLGSEGNSFHPTLFLAMLDLHTLFEQREEDFIITSLWRRKTTDSGIHESNPLRALDCRSRHLSAETAGWILTRFNQMWKYDPTRLSMDALIRHDVGQGDHFHLQVCERTVKVF